MSVLESFNESIAEAMRDGTLDEKRHGAAIEAARKLASMMDEPTWPMVNGKLDNVSPGVFLKYCTALNLVPNDEMKPKQKAKKPNVATVVGNSKWSQKRAVNG